MAAAYFPKTAIDDLKEGFSKVVPAHEGLRQKYISRTYISDRGKEYGTHGFGRRLGTLVRCIENIYTTLPPEQVSVPDRDVLLDVSVNIQAFVTNVVGCCDNLAWVWVFEKNVLKADGSELHQGMVGLDKKYREVWRSLPVVFREYLLTRLKWFAYVKDFRDSLSHRIPLYIPPYYIHPLMEDEHRRLEQRSLAALLARDLDLHESVEAELDKLRFFRPWMVHSVGEGSEMPIFHAQVLADFNTVVELGEKFLEHLPSSRT